MKIVGRWYLDQKCKSMSQSYGDRRQYKKYTGLLILLYIIACFWRTGSNLVEAKGKSDDIKPSTAALYLDKIDNLEKKFGKCSIKEYPYGVPGEDWRYASGLSYTSLIDFDMDGTKELFVVWHDRKRLRFHFQFGIFTDHNNRCVKLGQADVSADGSPIIFWFGISRFDNHPCVVSYSAWELTAYGIKNHKMVKYLDKIDTVEEENRQVANDISNNIRQMHELNGEVNYLYPGGMGDEINRRTFFKAVKQTKRILRAKCKDVP